MIKFVVVVVVVVESAACKAVSDANTSFCQFFFLLNFGRKVISGIVVAASKERTINLSV